ncbi:MAG TPA: ABC transporter substrate-binding protein [Pedobacter sp.]|jgi:iron complex transport system substrate-binding protein
MTEKSRTYTLAFRKGIFLSRHRIAGFITCASILFLLSSFGNESASLRARKSLDLYPEKVKLKYAKNFSINYFGTYKVVNVRNYYGGQIDTLQYLLVDKKHPIPKGYPNAQIIRTPVKSFVNMSSMHIAMTSFAESANSIVGLGSFKYVSSPVVRQNIKAGRVQEVGLDGSMNNELIISMKPDVVMVMGNTAAKFSRYQTLTGAGIPVLSNFEWLESTPLARMEWVKLMAALVNKEALVNKKFNQVEKEYFKLVQVGKKAKTRPLIIYGMPFKGTWLMPDADSYNTQLFKDAAATYKWSKEKGTGSLPLSFEAVAPVALKANYWLNVGYVDSKADILAKDSRFAHFKPFKNNKIYNHNKKVNDLGSNDFWESGGVNPHLILADLIKILHPELLPNHRLVYYKQLH